MRRREFVRAAGGETVRRFRKLQRDARPSHGHPQDMAAMVAPRLSRPGANGDGDPRGPEPRVSLPPDKRIWVLHRRDDAARRRPRRSRPRKGSTPRNASTARGSHRASSRRAASPASSNAIRSACGLPPGAVAPRPMTAPPFTRIAPTDGFGAVRPSDRDPRLRAASIQRRSSSGPAAVAALMSRARPGVDAPLPAFAQSQAPLRARRRWR